MQNRDAIKQKKSLGQVFLKEDWPCVKIVQLLKKSGVRKVLEIGPGNGALTRELLKAGFEVLAVEKDGRFANRIEQLRDDWPADSSRLEVLHLNILKFSLEDWVKSSKEPVAVCGNIPYNISSQILHWALPHLDQLKAVVFLVQLEFGQRLASKPSNKSYGSLSVFTQMRAKVNLEFQVPRAAFHPVPKVDSAVITLLPLRDRQNKEILEIVETLARQSFTQRRKKLSNSLAPILKKYELTEVPIDLNRRCDSLSTSEFILIAQSIIETSSYKANKEKN